MTETRIPEHVTVFCCLIIYGTYQQSDEFMFPCTDVMFIIDTKRMNNRYSSCYAVHNQEAVCIKCIHISFLVSALCF